ncbi:MAG: ArsR/SmtB family transcription factor [Syntrophomonadaceae bacterium]|jgi:DNA-binding transcriptional ArsR family regulator
MLEVSLPVQFVDQCGIRCIHEDKVREVKERMMGNDILSSLVDIFKAMADGTRLKILYSLMQTELCVCDLAAVTGASESAVSHQLRILRSYKLIKYRRDGKILYYSLADDHVRTLFDQGYSHVTEK